MILMSIEKFKGIVVASPTPFDSSRNIDTDGTKRMLNYFIDSGLDGIFLLSSTGEYFSITQEMKEKFIGISVAEVEGRLPLMVMVSDACLENVLMNIDRYSRKKIDAVVLTPPYYYGYSQDELYEFFTSAADRSPVPLLLYNQPMRLPSSIEVELAEALSKHNNIIGIKDTSTDAIRLLKLLRAFDAREDFNVYSGTEGLAAYAALFGGNFVYALAAVRPDIFKEMLKRGRQKDIEGIMALQDKINKLSLLFNTIKKGYKDSFSNFTHCIKAALKLKGICNEYNSQLGFELDDQDYERVRKVLDQI